MSNCEFFDQLAAAVSKAGTAALCMPDSPAWRGFLQNASVRRSGSAPAAERPAPPVPPPVAAAGGDLGTLGQQALSCRGCPLCEQRTNVVFGEGDPHARLMFIGEGPGFDEDRLGRPFVGKAGQLLDKMIAAMQFTRESVYICNIVKCRPPGNRVPMPEEAESCLPYLKAQIALVSPQVIVLLGATAAHYLLGRQEGITRLRGRWLDYNGIAVMPTYHPAFLLRKPEAKRDAWSDLQQVMAKFNKFHRSRPAAGN